MAKAEVSPSQVPHLDEAFATAQVVSGSAAQAENRVRRAYLAVGSTNRFSLLAWVIGDSGLVEAVPEIDDAGALGPAASTDAADQSEPANAASGAEASVPQEAQALATPEAETPATPEAETPATPEAETPATPEAETPATPEAETLPELQHPAKASLGPALPAAPTFLLTERIAAQDRGRRVLSAFSNLTPPERVVCFLGARRIRSSGDLAVVLGVPLSHAAQLAREAFGRFSAGLNPPQMSSEDGAEAPSGPMASESYGPDLNMLALVLDGLLEGPGTHLHAAINTSLIRLPGPVPRKRGYRLVPIAGILLLALASAIAVIQLLGRAGPPTIAAPVHLLDAVVREIPDARLVVGTSNPVEAQRWLFARVGWRFSIPTVSGADLSGVGFSTLAGSIQVPVLFYGSGESSELAVAVLNYATLERESDLVILDRPTLDRLAELADPEIRTIQGHSAVAIRNRDDIFLAVATEIDVNLSNRLSFAD
jgi:DNA-directed RNA polymerase specialized sigma24 family protein